MQERIVVLLMLGAWSVLPQVTLLSVSAGYIHTIHVQNSSLAVNDSSCWNGNQSKPCQNLDEALKGMKALGDSVLIIIDPGTYTLEGHHTFFNQSNVSVVGNTTNKLGLLGVLIYCSPFSGLTFNDSSMVVLESLTLNGCGVVENSSSLYHSMSLQTAVYMLMCMHVSLQSVHIVNSNGTGLTMYNVGGENLLQDCSFTGSHPPLDSKAMGGSGLQIEFTFCVPGDDECSQDNPSPIDSKYYSYSSYNISRVSVSSNLINNFEPLYVLVDSEKTNYTYTYGAGVSVTFKGSATGNLLHFSSCTVFKNSAQYGSGFFVTFQKMAEHNLVSMTETVIHENRRETSSSIGGGVMVLLMSENQNAVISNSIDFRNCSFTSNAANWGGGIGLIVVSNLSLTFSSIITFTNCSFSYNQATSGYAVDLVAFSKDIKHPFGYVPAVKFNNCHFLNNKVSDRYSESDDYNSVQEGAGALLTKNVPMYFSGYNEFINNSDTALVMIGESLTLEDDTYLLFKENVGYNGGAITILQGSYLILNYNTTLYFIRNRAKNYGGAIYSDRYKVDYLNLGFDCFITFFRYVDPNKWPVNVTFENNFAGTSGSAIYSSYIGTCQWNNNTTVFCWDPFYFLPHSCSHRKVISSEVMYMTADPHMTVFSGQRQDLGLSVFDRNHAKIEQNTMILRALISSNNEVAIDPQYTYITNNSIVLLGFLNDTAKLTIKTSLSSFSVKTTIGVSIIDCPPGCAQQSGNASSCVPDGMVSYSEHVKCNGTTSTLSPGYCITSKDNNSAYLVVGTCPLTVGNSRAIPVREPYSTSLCAENNTIGRLCGKCNGTAGYGPDFNSEPLKCARCHPLNWIVLVFLTFLPTTVLFVILVIFNVSLTKPPVSTFIFYSQIVCARFAQQYPTFIYAPGTSDTSILNGLTIVYGIWSLDFLPVNAIHLCPSTTVSPLLMVSFHYITAFYPLLLVILSYIWLEMYSRGVSCVTKCYGPAHRMLIRFHRKWSPQASVIETFAAFILLSYTKFSNISILLLSPSNMFNASGSVVGTAAFVDGTVDYFGFPHIYFAVLAILILAVFVVTPPIFLMLYQFRVVQGVLQKCGFRGQLIVSFTDIFQGCYKNGTEGSVDYRFFAGVYFVLRIVVFSIFAITTLHDQFTAQLFFSIFGILLISWIAPYKNDMHNKLDITIFVVLALLSEFSLISIYMETNETEMPTYMKVLTWTTFYLPVVAMVGYILCMLCLKGKALQKIRGRHGVRYTVTTESISDLTESFGMPDRVLHPDGYPQHKYRGIPLSLSVSIAGDQPQPRVKETEHSEMTAPNYGSTSAT